MVLLLSQIIMICIMMVVVLAIFVDENFSISNILLAITIGGVVVASKPFSSTYL